MTSVAKKPTRIDHSPPGGGGVQSTLRLHTCQVNGRMELSFTLPFTPYPFFGLKGNLLGNNMVITPYYPVIFAVTRLPSYILDMLWVRVLPQKG